MRPTTVRAWPLLPRLNHNNNNLLKQGTPTAGHPKKMGGTCPIGNDYLQNKAKGEMRIRYTFFFFISGRENDKKTACLLGRQFIHPHITKHLPTQKQSPRENGATFQRNLPLSRPNAIP